MSQRHPLNRLVVVASTPRSGSTLLFSALHASGIGANEREALNPAFFPRHLTGLSHFWYQIGRPYTATARASRRSVRRALRTIAAESTMEDGTLTLKVMWSHLDSVLLSHGLDLDVFGVPIVWIRIRRVDLIQQAVSLSRAQQTNRWKSTRDESRTPLFDADHIAEQLEFLVEGNDRWDSYLDARGATPLQVTYEELDADYEGTMRRVFDFIGASDIAVAPPQLARQADQLNAEWIERFLASPVFKSKYQDMLGS